MSSRFNKLYHGTAADVAAIMDDNKPRLSIEELQLVLTNAMKRIASLEESRSGDICRRRGIDPTT